MGIHIYITYHGGKDMQNNVLPPGNALIEINKDKTWKLVRTSGQVPWWKNAATSYSGNWEAGDPVTTFYGSEYPTYWLINNKEPISVFKLRDFDYPPEINASGIFLALWDKDGFQIKRKHSWQVLLTDELLKETIEKFDRIQREIIEIGIQSSLDTVAIFDQTGAASVASAGYALSRGDYVTSITSLVTAIPLLGKFGAASKAAEDARIIAADTAELKKIQDAIKSTGKANEEIHLASQIPGKVTVSEIALTRPLKEGAELGREAKKAAHLAESGGTVPLARLQNQTGQFGKQVKQTARELRNSRSVVPSTRLANQSDRFRNAGNVVYTIPQKLANKLAGKSFGKFDSFRVKFWKEVAEEETLWKQFTYDSRNLGELRKGNAPYIQAVDVAKQSGITQKLQLHHMTPIGRGGAVYDIGNLLVVTPAYHLEVLEKIFHFGK